jgi:hypothetical protein
MIRNLSKERICLVRILTNNPFPGKKAQKLPNITDMIETEAAKEYRSLVLNSAVLIQTNWGWLHDSFQVKLTK